jgi:hypothetical protein
MIDTDRILFQPIALWLHDGGLVLATGAEEASEARARAIGIVALASARAVTARFISVAIQRVSARGTLL